MTQNLRIPYGEYQSPPFPTSAGLIVTVTDLGEERENTQVCMSTSGLIFIQTNWLLTCYICFILKAGGFSSILLYEVKFRKYTI